VHSYYCSIKDTSSVAGITEYGISFHSSIEKNNIFGCQFHPEKSQKSGLNIFKNFNLV
jgi:glutamine amidotransferase